MLYASANASHNRENGYFWVDGRNIFGVGVIMFFLSAIQSSFNALFICIITIEFLHFATHIFYNSFIYNMTYIFIS